MGVRDRLADLYARVPVLKCKGLCQDSCGPILATRDEVRLMERSSGRRHGWQLKTARCTLLDDETGRCSCYRDRPLVCRAWGTVATSTCPFGCEPDHWLTQEQFERLLAQVSEIAGPHVSPAPFVAQRPATTDECRAAAHAADLLIARGLRLPDRWDVSQPHVICPRCRWRGQVEDGFPPDAFVGDNCPQCGAGTLRLAQPGDTPLFVPGTRA